MAFKITTENALWGLDRIDQTAPPLDGLFRYNSNGGSVDVCILDTGIDPLHVEFGTLNSVNRVRGLYDFRQNLPVTDLNYVPVTDDRWSVDDYGHGTWVASIVGGYNVGVADGVTLYSVKIFNKNLETKTQYIEEGLSAVLDFHNNKTNQNPTICLCSWAGFMVDDGVVRSIIALLISSGVVVISTAGNYDRDISTVSPAGYPDIISVGGSDKSDKFNNPGLRIDNSFKTPSPSGNEGSNYGNITIIAPSFRIKGAWISTNFPSLSGGISSLQHTEYRILSNNAAAAAFVAGVAAFYLEANALATQVDVTNHLIKTSVKNIIKLVPEGTPNRLLKSVFNPHVFVWGTKEGELISVSENSPVELTIEAYGRDGSGIKIPVEFSINSGNFPQGSDTTPGLILETNTGRIFGSSPEVSAGTLGYVPINTLPMEDRGNFTIFQKGYVDYTFSIRIEDAYGFDVRNFYIRVVDNNDIPQWLTDINTPASLNNLPLVGDLYYKDLVNIDLQKYPYVFDINGDDISFSLLNGELPPGLELSETGLIYGTVGAIYPKEYTYPDSVGLIHQDFYFTLRATDGTVVVDRYLNLRIHRDGSNNTPPVFDQPNWTISTVGDFFEGGVIDIKFTTNDPDEDKVLYYKVQPPNSLGLPPETFIIASSAPDEEYYDLSELTISETDWNWTAIPTAENSVIATAKVYHRTPEYVNIDVSGNLRGVLTVLNDVGNYYFQIDAYDGWNITSETFRIHVDPLEINIITAIASLAWITPPGNLGSINETYPSYFGVKASTADNTPIKYSLVNSSESGLPPGINLNEDTGDLRGYFGYVSADTTYNFRIRAELRTLENAAIEGDFSITVNKVWNGFVSEVYFSLTGQARYRWLDMISTDILNNQNNSQTLIPKETWFKADDDIFGVNYEPKIYIIGGLPVLTDQELFDAMSVEANMSALNTGYERYGNYWSPITVQIGDLKSAVGRDDSGNILYEVIYYEIYDPNNKNLGITSQGVVDPIANDDITSPVDYFYPTSILNWRRDFIGDVGLDANVERLPLWMKSPQVSAKANDIIGYKSCIELIYVQPGTSQNFLNTIKFTPNKIIKRGEKILIDRIIYSDLTDVNNPKNKIIKFPPGDKFV